MINALLAEELAKRHDVTVLTSQGLGAPGESDENGVRVIRVPVFFRRQQAAASLVSMFAYMPMGIRSGKKLLESTPYDIINTHFVLPTGPVGDVLARFGQIPNVLSVHGGDVYDPSKWTSPHRHALLRLWVRRLLRRADRVVGQSRNTLENVQQFYTPDIQGIRIPLGIKRPPMETASRQQYGFDEDDILLITVGRLVPRKALNQLVAMMVKVGHPNAHLLVLGTGPQERRLRDQARQLKVGDRTHFLGYVDEEEKFRILRMSDIFVSTSQHEGFGLVFLEGMACGLPVICYDHGGQTDFLENERTGYVLRLNDQASFVDRCNSLLRNVEVRKEMGKENLNRAEELFINRCAARYEEVFSDVITEHQRTHDIGHSARS